MNVILSTTLCFGLLTLLSVMIFLESVHGLPYFIQDKEDTDGEELLLALLNKNFGFQRSSNIDIELANKLEEPNQLEMLKEQLTEAKDAEMSYAIDGLSSSHPNKRDCCCNFTASKTTKMKERDRGCISAISCLSSGTSITSTDPLPLISHLSCYQNIGRTS
uniref:Uncharacterized protein n=1 Tax=Ovis aries TaxID=9940 RepID=A0AC11CIM5_SHEEP